MDPTEQYYGAEGYAPSSYDWVPNGPFRGPIIRLWSAFLTAAATVWRRLLFRTTFIAITGSSGKTTAKECLYAILASRYPTIRTLGNREARLELPSTILRARPWHRFVIGEIGIVEPGRMWRSALLFRPDIAIVLNVNVNHRESFGDLDTTAREKGQLVRGLARGGTAVLNADDPRVRGMTEVTSRKAILYGTDPASDVRALEVRSRWPERLSFEVEAEDESSRVQTQLVGQHWVTSALAAIAAARQCGMTLHDAASAISVVPPFPARMQPLPLPSGATVVRDDFNPYIDSFEPALDWLASYRNGRRILVITQVLDIEGNERHRYLYIGRAAAEKCELCIFVGPNSDYARRKARSVGMDESKIRSVKELRDVTRFLETETQPTDLILLRGRTQDHVARAVLAVSRDVTCWKRVCKLKRLCDVCPELTAAGLTVPTSRPQSQSSGFPGKPRGC